MFQFRQASKQSSTVEELCDGVRSIKLILCHFCAATDNREDQARECSDVGKARPLTRSHDPTSYSLATATRTGSRSKMAIEYAHHLKRFPCYIL